LNFKLQKSCQAYIDLMTTVLLWYVCAIKCTLHAFQAGIQ